MSTKKLPDSQVLGGVLEDQHAITKRIESETVFDSYPIEFHDIFLRPLVLEKGIHQEKERCLVLGTGPSSLPAAKRGGADPGTSSAAGTAAVRVAAWRHVRAANATCARPHRTSEDRKSVV